MGALYLYKCTFARDPSRKSGENLDFLGLWGDVRVAGVPEAVALPLFPAPYASHDLGRPQHLVLVLRRALLDGVSGKDNPPYARSESLPDPTRNAAHRPAPTQIQPQTLRAARAMGMLSNIEGSGLRAGASYLLGSLDQVA